MELILWRHCEADAQTPDSARQLTKKGRKQASRMADWLNPRLPQGARVLVSPTARTVETAQALGRDFERSPDLAPGASADAVLRAAGWPEAEGCVLVVGHQPTLGQVAIRVLTGQAGDAAMRKGAVWWFEGRERGSDTDVLLKAVVSPDWL
jgi:phosphohistidine phosphatase